MNQITVVGGGVSGRLLAPNLVHQVSSQESVHIGSWTGVVKNIWDQPIPMIRQLCC